MYPYMNIWNSEVILYPLIRAKHQYLRVWSVFLHRATDSKTGKDSKYILQKEMKHMSGGIHFPLMVPGWVCKLNRQRQISRRKAYTFI